MNGGVARVLLPRRLSWWTTGSTKTLNLSLIPECKDRRLAVLGITQVMAMPGGARSPHARTRERDAERDTRRVG